MCTNLFVFSFYRLVPIPIPTSNYKSEEEKAELAANLIQDTKGIGNYELIHSSLKHLLKDTTLVDEVHFWKLWIDAENFYVLKIRLNLFEISKQVLKFENLI